MIQARKLGHVVLKVRDAGKSRDFYVKTLGLKVAHEDLTRGAVFLSFGTEHHDLAVFQMASGETPAAEQPGLHHMAWQLGSFEGCVMPSRAAGDGRADQSTISTT
jgi:catechol-2,3-dioxygenase